MEIYQTVIALSAVFVSGVIGLILGPACWKTYKAHVDQLQEYVDDLQDRVATETELRRRTQDENIALKAEISLLKAQRDADRRNGGGK